MSSHLSCRLLCTSCRAAARFPSVMSPIRLAAFHSQNLLRPGASSLGLIAADIRFTAGYKRRNSSQQRRSNATARGPPQPPQKEATNLETGQESPDFLGTTKRLPEFSLTDKVVLVTGAARGLGLVQAEALLEAGATGKHSRIE